jgi:broad specificity phosphatase PhoE
MSPSDDAARARPAALLLVRHGESRGNVADFAARDAQAPALDLDVRDPDVDLSDTGARQAAALGRWLAGRPEEERPTVVLTSPYVRAARTAELAVEAAGLPVRIVRDERLRERDLGIFDGLTGLGIRERFPDEAERRNRLGKFYYRPPSGESWADVALRVRSLMSSVAQECGGQRVALFSHQAVVMVFRYVLEGMAERDLLAIDADTQIANCAVTEYHAHDGGWRLQRFNDVEHLAVLAEPVTEEPDATAVSS